MPKFNFSKNINNSVSVLTKRSDTNKSEMNRSNIKVVSLHNDLEMPKKPLMKHSVSNKLDALLSKKYNNSHYAAKVSNKKTEKDSFRGIKFPNKDRSQTISDTLAKLKLANYLKTPEVIIKDEENASDIDTQSVSLLQKNITAISTFDKRHSKQDELINRYLLYQIFHEISFF